MKTLTARSVNRDPGPGLSGGWLTRANAPSVGNDAIALLTAATVICGEPGFARGCDPR